MRFAKFNHILKWKQDHTVKRGILNPFYMTESCTLYFCKDKIDIQ